MDDFDSPGPAPIEGDTKTYYPNKPLAQTAVNRGQLKYAEQGIYSGMAQFEPNRGFVAVLFGERNIPEAWDEGFEVITAREIRTPQKTDPDWHKPKPKPASSGGSAGASTTVGTAPAKGATKRVWDIANKLHAESPLTRAHRNKVIDACIEDGINKSTAATQWSKWAKARGL